MIFEKPGKQNTEDTLRLAVEAARERGIGSLVVATVEGYTPLCLHDTEGLDVIVVSHAFGYRDKTGNELSEENRALLEQRGYRIHTAAHALSGAERALSNRFQGVYPVEIIAHTLRMFGQGTKVCVEVAIMACDAGLITPGERVIAIGGTGRGADTALILRPGCTHTVLETRIDEIICKPIT